MSSKRFFEISNALVCGDRATATALSGTLLTFSDTAATRAGIARTVTLAGGGKDHRITLAGFGHIGILTDALIAYSLREGLVITVENTTDILLEPRVSSIPTCHLVRLPVDADSAAIGKGLQAYPVGSVLLVPDPGVEVPVNLAGHLILNTGTFGTNGAPSWVDERRLGDDLAMLTPQSAKYLANAVINHICSRPVSTIKMILTDLDDTLWGGVLGEDGPDGLDMIGRGERDFAAYQEQLARLARQGVLIACVSRNRAEDVDAVFSSRRELNIRKEDFLAIRASWAPKAEVIRNLLDQAQVAPEAAVFIDNDPVERGRAAAAIPGLLIPQDGDWSAKCLARLEAEGRFMTNGSREDHLRRESTQVAMHLRDAINAAGSRDALLASLGMRISFEDIGSANRERALQLAARVTQFRTASTPKDWEQSGYQAFLLRLEETGVDHGRVGMVLWRHEGNTATIDLLCLSCRVLNRSIDTALLAETARRAEALGARLLVGRIEDLPRNAPARDVYLRHNFISLEQGLFHRKIFGIDFPSHFCVDIDSERHFDNEYT